MVVMVADMVMYETVRLRGYRGYTEIYNFATKENRKVKEHSSILLDEYNKKGYFLTAVNSFIDGIDYYLSKRID